MTATRVPTIVAGIDVGGATKGFHAVSLSRKDVVGKFWSVDPRKIAVWCEGLGAKIVGIDAPIAWSLTGRSRAAERALMQEEIWCFSTPSEEIALSHPTNHYGWMRNGADLYRALRRHFTCYNGRNEKQWPVVFETFPHAITCSLMGEVVSATQKRTMRRALLARLNVSCDSLANMDFVDAALCALTANYFARGRFDKYGDPVEGYIVVPR